MRIEPPSFEERMCGACAWLALLIILMAVLTGCASDRYLTAEEDAALRARCEATGCKVVPMPLWQQIEELIRSLVPAEPRRGVSA